MTDFDPFTEAAAMVDREAENWMPHKPDRDRPDKTVGIFAAEGMSPDEGYGESKMVTLRERDGREWIVRLYATVLANEWARARPKIGEVVAVRYLGSSRPRTDGRSGATASRWPAIPRSRRPRRRSRRPRSSARRCA